NSFAKPWIFIAFQILNNSSLAIFNILYVFCAQNLENHGLGIRFMLIVSQLALTVIATYFFHSRKSMQNCLALSYRFVANQW
ncbi:hypothetical protein NAH09_09840, partial [Francisella tularensis subsp. holarctica]|uniref:hypothetical protein n=1 Tax=Francisella tularensis TaxID=263 RepID=UPI002381B318